MSNIHIFEYSNGFYQGEVQGNARQGMGVYMWDSGQFYYGFWNDDNIEGEGITYFPFGGSMHGMFLKNKVHGPAVLEFPNRDIYKGEWRNGKLHGECIKYFPSNDTFLICEYFDGVFQKTKKKGKGQPPQSGVENLISSFVLIPTPSSSSTVPPPLFSHLIFPDSAHFIGLTLNYLPHGFGLFAYRDGKSDVGYYVSGVLDGVGRLNFQNGDIYGGRLTAGQLHGRGVFYRRSVDRWVAGIFDGNRCLEVLERGGGKEDGVRMVERYREEEHLKSGRFKGKGVEGGVFEIPKLEGGREEGENKENEGRGNGKERERRREEEGGKNQNNSKNGGFSSPVMKNGSGSKHSNDSLIGRGCSVGVGAKPAMVEQFCQTEEEIEKKKENIKREEWTQTEEKEDSARKEIAISRPFETEQSQSQSQCESSCFASNIHNASHFNDQQQMTRSQIESLFRSVKELIAKPIENPNPSPTPEIKPNVVKISENKPNSIKISSPQVSPSSSTSFIQQSISHQIKNRDQQIKARREATELLIQKLESLKRSKEEAKTSLLNSLEYSVSRTESGMSKFSNLVESKFIDSNLWNSGSVGGMVGGKNNNNIAKSIDYIESLLSSQNGKSIDVIENLLASQNYNEMGLSNIEMANNDFFAGEELDLFQSRGERGGKGNLKVSNNDEKLKPSDLTNNNEERLLMEKRNNSNSLSNCNGWTNGLFSSEKEAKINVTPPKTFEKEIIMKYGIGGMEKIEEKVEEMSFSPNCKNEGLVFGSLRENGKGIEGNFCKGEVRSSEGKENEEFKGSGRRNSYFAARS